ncbi:hypothetical protein ACH5RR_000471 [Cinchona calisaya]|uniref:Uncharacterized protein n=1 Tax=Cinchona calisaya TaxID=153742 RepID=A0ABD3B0R9_9GENT
MQIGQRIQELHEMNCKYLMIKNNNDESTGKAVYLDSSDDILLLDLSKELWHDEFGNLNDDSGADLETKYEAKLMIIDNSQPLN